MVLCASLHLGLEGSEYQVLEFFAGKARITRLARSIRLRAAAHDVSFDGKNYGKSAMNINKASGFVPGPYLYLPKQMDSR